MEEHGGACPTFREAEKVHVGWGHGTWESVWALYACGRRGRRGQVRASEGE